MEPLEKKILNNIKKTGFIKELELARILNNKGWDSQLNSSYLDKDTGINREIDIIASKKGNIDYHYLHLWVDLVIEVKKADKPWVIVTNSDDDGLNYRLNPGWGIIHGGEKYIDIGGIFPPRIIDKYFMRNQSVRIGSSFYEAFKESSEVSKIYQAIMSACKAAVYKSKIHGASPKWDDYGADDPTYLTFYHPVVVVDGPLYEVYLNENNEVVVSKINWIPVSYQYSSPQYSKEWSDTYFHCDIVQFDYMNTYLDLTQMWLEKMNENMVAHYKVKLERR